MSEDKRKDLRDFLDEFDRFFEDFEKGIENAIRSSINTGQNAFSRPVVAGMAMGLGPEGKPTINFFGDNLVDLDGFRAPVYEQVVDEKGGSLRLLVELPGVEKEDVQISAVADRVSVEADKEDRRYRVDVPLQREIDPDSGTASYRNGLLEAVFKIRDKTNKGYKRISIV